MNKKLRTIAGVTYERSVAPHTNLCIGCDMLLRADRARSIGSHSACRAATEPSGGNCFSSYRGVSYIWKRVQEEQDI